MWKTLAPFIVETVLSEWKVWVICCTNCTGWLRDYEVQIIRQSYSMVFCVFSPLAPCACELLLFILEHADSSFQSLLISSHVPSEPSGCRHESGTCLSNMSQCLTDEFIWCQMQCSALLVMFSQRWAHFIINWVLFGCHFDSLIPL